MPMNYCWMCVFGGVIAVGLIVLLIFVYVRVCGFHFQHRLASHSDAMSIVNERVEDAGSPIYSCHPAPGTTRLRRLSGSGNTSQGCALRSQIYLSPITRVTYIAFISCLQLPHVILYLNSGNSTKGRLCNEQD